MQTMQGSTLRSLRAVQGFLDAHADVLGAVVTSGARKQLDQIVTELDEHVGTQSGSNLAAQSATQRHRTLRAAIVRDHMAPIAKIAAAQLPTTPEVEPLKLPKGKPSTEQLRSLAIGMAKAATPFTQTFIDAGLPADFVAQLVSAADALVHVVGARKANRVARGGATQGLKTLLSSGRKTVNALDAMVKSAFKGDPTMTAAWRIAKRVERTPGGRAGTGATVPAGTGATVPVVAAGAVASVVIPVPAPGASAVVPVSEGR